MNLGYGLEVTGVSNGKMAEGGVRKGFIILKVNNIPMKTVEDLEKVMKEAAKTQEQVFYYRYVPLWKTWQLCSKCRSGLMAGIAKL